MTFSEQSSEQQAKSQLFNVFISDAFLLHGSELHLYSKINIENVKINTRTVAVFRALPTCIAQRDCGACVSLRARSQFRCMWCEAAGHCSDGADRWDRVFIFVPVDILRTISAYFLL